MIVLSCLRTSRVPSYYLSQNRYRGIWRYLELINFSRPLLYSLYLQPNWTPIPPRALPMLFCVSAQTIHLANTALLPFSICENSGRIMKLFFPMNCQGGNGPFLNPRSIVHPLSEDSIVPHT